jgi:hypothetical protein
MVDDLHRSKSVNNTANALQDDGSLNPFFTSSEGTWEPRLNIFGREGETKRRRQLCMPLLLSKILLISLVPLLSLFLRRQFALTSNSLPKDHHLDTQFGSYTLHSDWINGGVYYGDNQLRSCFLFRSNGSRWGEQGDQQWEELLGRYRAGFVSLLKGDAEMHNQIVRSQTAEQGSIRN